MHVGRRVTIMRNQNQDNTINPECAMTSRKCPPFCIQPSELAPGVKTVAELDVLRFLKTISEGVVSRRHAGPGKPRADHAQVGWQIVQNRLETGRRLAPQDQEGPLLGSQSAMTSGQQPN